MLEVFCLTTGKLLENHNRQSWINYFQEVSGIHIIRIILKPNIGNM